VTTRQHFGSVRLRGRLFEASYWHDSRRHLAPTRFLTKADARAFLASVETDIRRGSWIDPTGGRLRVRELAEIWSESDPNKRESTRCREELTLRLHVIPTLGESRIEGVGPVHIQRLVNNWGISHAPRTVKRNYEVVRAMFGLAVRNDWLARSPCRNIKLPQIDGTRRHELTGADVGRIVVAIPLEYRLMVWMGAALGLRWSEVAGLRAGRIDLLGARLTVSEALTRGIGGRNVFGAPKSKAGCRTMYVPNALIDMLVIHMARAGIGALDVNSLVFTDEEGGSLRYSNWRRRVWQPAARAAGCEGAGFHDLRRLNATTLVVGGVDVKTAQVRLGHADPRMTLNIYASASATADRRAADVLDNSFFGTEVDRAERYGDQHQRRILPLS
jgi:integrase